MYTLLSLLFVCITTCAYVKSTSFHFGKERRQGRQHLNLERHMPLGWQINLNKILLGAFAYSSKTPITFAMSVRPSVCLHVTAQLSSNGFS
jgi:hypothetical protein